MNVIENLLLVPPWFFPYCFLISMDDKVEVSRIQTIQGWRPIFDARGFC
jgi:hypothetical protein